MPTLFEDKYAIEERVGIYNLSLDQGHYEEFLSCWCEDGSFDGLAGMGGPFIGKAAIRTFTESYDERARFRLNGLKHFTTGIVSRIDGDNAKSASHLQLVMTGSKGVKILFTGRYEDSLRRVDGDWLFVQRKLHQDMPVTEAAPVAA